MTHGVEGRRASVQNLFNKFWEGSTGSPVFRELGDLLLGGDLAGEQEPEEGLRKRFCTTGCFWELSLNFRDSLATETDTLICTRVE